MKKKFEMLPNQWEVDFASARVRYDKVLKEGTHNFQELHVRIHNAPDSPLVIPPHWIPGVPYGAKFFPSPAGRGWVLRQFEESPIKRMGLPPMIFPK